MSTQSVPTVGEGLDVKRLFVELEVPFPPDQVLWRVTNTSNDKKRGQVVPYADQRAYTDRLNALLTPRGWTREYKVETLNNITRNGRRGRGHRQGSDHRHGHHLWRGLALRHRRRVGR